VCAESQNRSTRVLTQLVSKRADFFHSASLVSCRLCFEETLGRGEPDCAFGFPDAEDLGNMFQFKRDFNDDYCSARCVEQSRALNPSLQSFDDWLERNRTKIVFRRKGATAVLAYWRRRSAPQAVSRSGLMCWRWRRRIHGTLEPAGV
jgi:hypothetical protein